MMSLVSAKKRATSSVAGTISNLVRVQMSRHQEVFSVLKLNGFEKLTDGPSSRRTKLSRQRSRRDPMGSREFVHSWRSLDFKA